MPDTRLTRRLTRGALSGFVGTTVMQGVRSASQRWLPETMPPIEQEPGAFMVKQAEESLSGKAGASVPATVETAAAQSLAVGYGLTAGGLYGALRSRGDSSVLLDGAVLGLGVWAVGYLGWLPASGLMPSLNQQTPKERIAPALRHVIFGVATVATYRWLMSDDQT